MQTDHPQEATEAQIHPWVEFAFRKNPEFLLVVVADHIPVLELVQVAHQVGWHKRGDHPPAAGWHQDSSWGEPVQERVGHQYPQVERSLQRHPSEELVGTDKAQLAEEERCGRLAEHCNNLE